MTKLDKKTDKKTENQVDVTKLIESADKLKIDSKIVLAHIAKNDLEGLAALINTETEKIQEKQAVIEIVKDSGLNKQFKNCLGLWIYGQWNLFTSATTKWLQPVATLAMTPEFSEFMASEKRLADIKKFITFLEK